MNENKLTDALGMIGEDEICGYFEYKEALSAKKRTKARKIFAQTVIAAALLLFAFAMIPAMLIGNGEDTLPEAGSTEDIGQNTPGNTEPPAVDETTLSGNDQSDPFSRENVLIVESFTNSDSSSPYHYTIWEGLDISRLLEYGIDRYKDQAGKYFVINVFRRNGEHYFTDYVYEGKTYEEWADTKLMVAHKASLVRTLIQREGEILKYSKEVITVTGIPVDDPAIDDSEKGVRWAESLYDKVIDKYNSCDPEMLSRYIVDGDFLSELAESDLILLEAEYDALEEETKKKRAYYFQRHEEGDLGLFDSLGFTAGEINGKLYIFATLDQLRGLAAAADMSPFSFTPLPSNDYYDAYPVSKLPDDYKLEQSVSGFALDKFVFSYLRFEDERYIDVTVSSDEELYCAIEETIHKYKRSDLYIELQFYAERENGTNYCIDISDLEGLKHSGYYVAKYSFLTAVKLRFEDFNDPEIMEALRDLSLREEITRINVMHCFYVP